MKKSKILSLFIILMLPIVGIFFPILSNFGKNADATISDVSGENFILTGQNGSATKHYFFDSSNNVTLQCVNVEEGQDGYYTFTQNNDVRYKRLSSGYADIRLTDEMKAFAEAGTLYAYASFGFNAGNNNLQSNIRVKISGLNQKGSEVSSSETRTDESGARSTTAISVKGAETVRFHFETLAETGLGKYSKFTLSKPTIHFYTDAGELTLKRNNGGNVEPGESISEFISNAVTSVSRPTGSSVYWGHAQTIHKIKYEITEGEEFAKIIVSDVDNVYNLQILNSAPEGQKISIKVSYIKQSNSDHEISQTINYTVKKDYGTINVETEFGDERPAANIVFPEEAKVGAIISLSVRNVNTAGGFAFIGWEVDGTIVSRRMVYSSYVVKKGQNNITAKFSKEISINKVTASKVYDGTNEVTDYTVDFNGKMENHDLTIKMKTSSDNIDFPFTYATTNVGENITLEYDNVNLQKIVLAGKDADIYTINAENITAISTTGTITKRDALIIAESTSKEYGNNDPIFTYTTKDVLDADKDYLNGEIGREEGSAVGDYALNLGTISHSNYNFAFENNGAVLTIEPRTLSLTLIASSKDYDGTTDAQVNITVSNVFAEEDVKAKALHADFAQSSVGTGIEVHVDIENIILEGEHAENYRLPETINIAYADINRKVVVVYAQSGSVVYGEEAHPTYSCEGIIEGDENVVSGEVYITGKDVGFHDIQGDRLSCNENYRISFVSAQFEITKRPVVIRSESYEKQFGDEDPIFNNFTYENVVEGETIEGTLSRVEGSAVGQYALTLGDLAEKNKNYSFTLEAGAVLVIKERAITVYVSFVDKQYDGTNVAKYEASFANVLSYSNFAFLIDATLTEINVSEGASVIFDEEKYTITGNDVDSYIFTVEYGFSHEGGTVNITRRDVIIEVDQLTKIYGEANPEEYSYTAKNVVEGETLFGEVKRNSGENAGNYTYYLDTLNNENNPNYNIKISDNQIPFVIKPKPVVLTVVDGTILSKVFDNDAENGSFFEFRLADGETLAFEDDFSEIFTGKLGRSEGEYAGEYSLTQGTVSANGNYEIVVAQLKYTITKRKVTVTSFDFTKVYGESDPKFDRATYSVDNEVSSSPLELEITRDSGENVGDYQTKLGNSFDPRYEITYIPGTLTITPRKISVYAEDKTKFYGDADPVLNVYITEILPEGDKLDEITQGQLERNEGEDVGKYLITQGNLSFGDNYEINFISGNLSIIKEEIVIKAKDVKKIYGGSKIALGYEVLKGSLKFEDEFSGELEREIGEDVGIYAIMQGSLSLSSNYDIEFIEGTYEIEKRAITIQPINLSKVYGEEDPEMLYDIVEGSKLDQDEFEGGIYRAEGENAGEYKITCTLANKNYEITFGSYNFVIKQRVIKIQAKDIEINYGDEEPELEFDIIEGEILEGDNFVGELYRVSGNNAGEYDIRSRLTLGRNYKIEFQKGTFKIKPIKIIVESSNYSKIYGQSDPAFTYTIVDGQLLNGEELHGSIGRVEGENAGIYKLVSNLSNMNYEISLRDAFLTINAKDVYLVAGVLDKPYDGTTKATIKTPVVTGLIDRDVILSFDKDNCVNFASAEVGNDIEVVFHDITLTGDKAANYHLIYPTQITGNIAYRELKNGEVTITSAKDANLYAGTTLEYNTFNITRKEMGLVIQKVLKGYNIHLEGNDISTSVTVTIELPKEIASVHNLYVYHKNSEGNYKIITSVRDDNGNIVITTDELGEFVIMTDNDVWIELAAFICLIILVLLIIIAIIVLCKKKHKSKKEKDERKQELAERQEFIKSRISQMPSFEELERSMGTHLSTQEAENISNEMSQQGADENSTQKVDESSEENFHEKSAEKVEDNLDQKADEAPAENKE